MKFAESGHMSERLGAEIHSYQLALVDDASAEGPHAHVSRTVKVRSASRPSFWSYSLRMEKNMEFFCKFDNIKNYPFGVQSCSFSFGLTGPANKLTKLNSVLSLHPSVENMNIGQYEILNWTMETKTTHSNQTVVIVTMNLTRYFTNMVVSL